MNWLLRDPNTLRVVLARAISRTGGEAAFFVGIWGKAAYELDASPGEQALLMGTMGISALGGSALAGVMVDRSDPRRVVMLSELFFVPSTLALALPDTIGQMTLVIVLAAACGGAVLTSVASMPPFLTDDPDRLHRINAAVDAGASFAFMLGPALGAIIVRYASIDWIFVLDAATSVVAVALVVGVALRTRPERAERRSTFTEMRAGFGFAFTHRALRLYIGVFIGLWLSFGAFAALEPLFYRDVLRVGPEALGWVNTIFGVGILAGSIFLGRLPPRALTARAAIVGVLGSGLGAVIYTGTDSLTVVVIGAVYWGIVLGAMFPMVRTLIQRATPDQLMGRVVGTTDVSSQVGELLPLTFVPALAALWGIQPVLVGSGVCVIVLGIAAWGEAGAVDRLPRKPVEVEPEFRLADEPLTPNP